MWDIDKRFLTQTYFIKLKNSRKQATADQEGIERNYKNAAIKDPKSCQIKTSRIFQFDIRYLSGNWKTIPILSGSNDLGY